MAKMLGTAQQDWQHTCYLCRHSRTIRRVSKKGQRAKEKRTWPRDQAD